MLFKVQLVGLIPSIARAGGCPPGARGSVWEITKILCPKKGGTKLGKDRVKINVNLKTPGRRPPPAADFVQPQWRAARQLVVAGRVGDAGGSPPIGRG